MYRKSGFSLIELMIVIVAVGILSTLSISGYRKYVKKARKASLYTIIRAADTAEQLYHTQYQTFVFTKSTTSVTAFQNLRDGTHITIDGGESAEMQTVWNELDLYPIGEQVHWYMVLNQGKFYSDGSAAQFNDTWDQGPISVPRFREYSTFPSQLDADGRNVGCSNRPVAFTFNPSDLGAEANPGRAYDWLSIGIQSSFLSSSYTDCTNIIKIKVYDWSTSSYLNGGYITFDDLFND